MRGLGQINKDCFKDPNCWITVCPGTRVHGLGSRQSWSLCGCSLFLLGSPPSTPSPSFMGWQLGPVRLTFLQPRSGEQHLTAAQELYVTAPGTQHWMRRGGAPVRRGLLALMSWFATTAICLLKRVMHACYSCLSWPWYGPSCTGMNRSLRSWERGSQHLACDQQDWEIRLHYPSYNLAS